MPVDVWQSWFYANRAVEVMSCVGCVCPLTSTIVRRMSRDSRRGEVVPCMTTLFSYGRVDEIDSPVRWLPYHTCIVGHDDENAIGKTAY